MVELQLSGGSTERWEQYREYVLMTLPIIEEDTPFTPALFACESAMISGEQPDNIPWPDRIARMKKDWEMAEDVEIGRSMAWARHENDRAAEIEAHQRHKEKKFPVPQWVEDFNLNDLLVATSCLSSAGRQRDIMHPMIANMPLCRHRLEPKWRNATYIGSNTGFPAARYVKRLTEMWRKIALLGARKLERATPEDRKVFSWALHDAFLSIQPFKDGNERTARVMFQLVRRELELPKVFFSRHSMIYHTSRVKAFRSGIFIPLMVERQYMS